MKLEELFEFRAVPDFGRPDASRMTPVTFKSMAPPLPEELYAQYEGKPKKKKKEKKNEAQRS